MLTDYQGAFKHSICPLEPESSYVPSHSWGETREEAGGLPVMSVLAG